MTLLERFDDDGALRLLFKLFETTSLIVLAKTSPNFEPLNGGLIGLLDNGVVFSGMLAEPKVGTETGVKLLGAAPSKPSPITLGVILLARILLLNEFGFDNER